MSKRMLKILPFVILLGGAGAFALLMVTRSKPQVAPSRADIAVVRTQEMQARSGALRILGDGFVVPRAEVQVMPQVSGQVVSVSDNLITGGRLAAGETLLQIDPTPYKADLDQAIANHKAALANLDNLKKQYERNKNLFANKNTSEAQLDQSYSAFKQAEAEVSRQEALITRRRFDLEQTTISLPFPARVVEESVDVGDTVSVGAQLARVYELGPAEITVSLTEADAALIPELWSRGQDRMHIDDSRNDALVTARFGNANYEWDGYLDRVNAGLNRDTRTVDVVVAVPHPQQPGRPEGRQTTDQDAPPLLIGTYARVSLTGRVFDSYYEIPADALREDKEIWVASPGSTLQVLPVHKVRQANNIAVITAQENLNGQRLITSGLAVPIPGMPLIIADREPAE